MIEEYTYRLYEKKDEPGIFELLKIVWGEKVAERSAVLWDWKINRNPYNPPEGPRSHLATHRDKIIAVMATIPMRFKFRDKTRTFLWVVDYLADPKYKTVGWRIFNRLHREPYILVGTPNYASYTIGIAAKWFELCDFYNYFRVVRIGKIAASKAKAAWVGAVADVFWQIATFGLNCLRVGNRGGEVQIHEVFSFGPEFEELWNAVSGGYEVIGIRSPQFLTWKYLDIPQKKFRIFLARKNGKPAGYIIVCNEMEKGYKKGVIVDFLTASDDAKTLSLLFQKAVDELKAEGADLISCFLIPYNRHHAKVLFRHGFIFRKKRYPAIADQTKTSDLTKAELTGAKWFITGGDSDLAVY